MWACGPSLAPEADEQERQEPEYRDHAADADGPQNRAAVLPGRRVVVIAEQQHLVGDRPEPVLGRFDQREAEIARREIDPEEIARDDALRRRDVDRRAVRVLLDVLVVRVAEPDRVGQRLDRCLGAGQEMPARRRLPGRP